MSGLAHVLNSLPDLCRGVLQLGLGLALQSTLLLGVGLLAGRRLRQWGPAASSLVYRATLVALVLGALAGLTTTGRLSLMRAIALPPSEEGAGGTITPDGAVLPSLAINWAWQDRRVHGAGSAEAIPVTPASGRPSSDTGEQELNATPGTDLTTPARYAPPLTPRTTPIGWLYLVLTGVWAGGAAFLLLRLAFCQRAIGRIRKGSLPANRAATGLLERLCAARQLRQPMLRVSWHVFSPVLIGIWRPAILLPASYEQDFEPPALQVVLAHELAHLARGDCGWLLFARLACALGWVQPFVWVLARRLEESSEEVCDEDVLRHEADPRLYARCLVDLAERLVPTRVGGSASIGMARCRSSVERRVRGILSRTERVRPPLTRSLRAVVVLGAAAAGMLGLFLGSATFPPAPEAADAQGVQVSRGESGSSGERQRSILEGVAALAKPITITETKIPLGELVEHVADDTGVPLTASADVADEPVTVVVKDLPARELMEQLAELLDYQWMRQGRAGKQRYAVYQDVASRKREDRLRGAAVADAWRRLGEQIPQYVEMAARPSAEIERLLDEEKRWVDRLFQLPCAQRLAMNMKDRALRRQYGMAEQLASPVARCEAALLGRLTPEQWVLLRQGQPLVFSTEPQAGKIPLPDEIARALHGAQPRMGPETHYGSPEYQRAQRERRQSLKTAWAEATGYQVRIMLDTSSLQPDGQLSLGVSAIPLHGGRPASLAASLPANGAMLGIGVGPTYVFPWGADAPDEKATAARRAALVHDPVFGANKPLKIDLTPRRPEEPCWKGCAGLGEMLPDVARTFGVSLISDAYNEDRTTARFSSREPIALYEVLDGLAGDRHVWDHHGRVIRFRYRSWPFARPKEVPMRLLRRWQALLDRDGALPLEEWLSVVSLTDAQLDSLLHWVMFRGPAVFGGPADPRYALRLYMSLMPGQQQALWQGRPLPFARMTPAQQGQFLATLRDQAQSRQGILVPGSEPALEPAAVLSLTSDRQVWVFEQHGTSTKMHYEPAPETAAASAPPTRAARAAAAPTITRRTITTLTFHFESSPEREQSVPIYIAAPS